MSEVDERRAFQLSLSDRRSVENAQKCAKDYGKELDGIKEYFLQKGWFGLWWDHIGFFGFTNPDEVSQNLDEYRELAMKLIEVTKLVENGNSNSCDELYKFYDELRGKEEEAERGLGESKSKTVVQMYKDFLQRVKLEIERQCSRVECIAQRIVIQDLKDGMDELREKHNNEAEEQRKQFESLKHQNEKLEKMVRASQDKVDELRRYLESDEERLQKMIEGKMKKLSLEADQRSQQQQEMFRESMAQSLEESARRADERLTRLLQAIKHSQK